MDSLKVFLLVLVGLTAHSTVAIGQGPYCKPLDATAQHVLATAQYFPEEGWQAALLQRTLPQPRVTPGERKRNSR